MAKDSDARNLEHKTFTIENKTVALAFSDKAAAYKDDKVIEKMLKNQIAFELTYIDKNYNYDHQTFINELIDRGIYVIQEITAKVLVSTHEEIGDNAVFEIYTYKTRPKEVPANGKQYNLYPEVN